MIRFQNESVRFNLKDKRKIKNWLKDIIEETEHLTGNITFVFCSDQFLLEINREYLNHDYYTDIITFDYCNNKLISGDIFISIDTVKDNAKRFNQGFLNELHRVMSHGVLHLLGFKDKSKKDAAIMREMEDYCLNLRNF